MVFVQIHLRFLFYIIFIFYIIYIIYFIYIILFYRLYAHMGCQIEDMQQERAQLTVEDGKLYTESWWVVLYVLYYLW